MSIKSRMLDSISKLCGADQNEMIESGINAFSKRYDERLKEMNPSPEKEKLMLKVKEISILKLKEAKTLTEFEKIAESISTDLTRL